MYYTVYKTTNTINNKEYIGAHESKYLIDEYMGSGDILRKAIKKYGFINFTKEIIFRAVSSDIMYWVERMIVDDNYIKRKDTYNIKKGGYGGWGYVNNIKTHEERSKNGKKGAIAANKVIKHKKETIEGYEEWYNSRMVQPISNPLINYDIIQKLKKTQKEISHQQGFRNSQYGVKVYIHKDALDKSVLKRYKKDTQPKNWITTAEWEKIQHQKIIDENPNNFRYKRKWFTDGVTNYLILPENATILMRPGQTRNKK